MRAGCRRYAGTTHPPRPGSPFPGLGAEIRTSPRFLPGRARQPDEAGFVPSTAALFETSLDLWPRTLVARIGLEVREPCVKQGTFLGRDGKVFLRKRVPKRLDQPKALLGIQPQGLFQQVRAHGRSISSTAAWTFNGWSDSTRGQVWITFRRESRLDPLLKVERLHNEPTTEGRPPAVGNAGRRPALTCRCPLVGSPILRSKNY